MNRLFLFSSCLALIVACNQSPNVKSPPSPLAPEAAAAPSAPARSAPSIPEAIALAVAAPDRSSEDRALDEGRKPGEVLAFFEVRPGQRVAELAAGGGYTAELLARVVGKTGRVYGINSRFLLDRFAEKPWTERLLKPVLSNVVRVDRDFDDPFPADVHDLDAVFCVLFYHDFVWQKVDRQKLNAAVFRALKPGGTYAIIDHYAAAGSGIRDVETLHRIDDAVVKSEITSAGFELVGSSDLLRNPSDTRDWSASPRVAGERRGTSDRFVLKFKKPQ